MGSNDKTPVERGKVECPHCREHVQVTVAGLIAMHRSNGRYKRRFCRGSGEPVKMVSRRRPSR